MRSDNVRDYGLNLAQAMVIAAFSSITWAYTVELQVRIFTRFKRYTGLYFWSLLTSSWGCAFHTLCYILYYFKFWTQKNSVFAIVSLTWIMMVTGQSLVLYSRLHLIMKNIRRVRWVLIMIISSVFIFHIPTIVLVELGVSSFSGAPSFLKAYHIYEKIQMTGFTLQEAIIAGLYVWETRKFLKPGSAFSPQKTQQAMRHLIWVNIFVISLDLALLATEYSGLFVIQTVFKPCVYSLILRLEFVVLNQLSEVLKGRGASCELVEGATSSRSRGGTNPVDSVAGRTNRERAGYSRIVAGNSNTYSVSAGKQVNSEGYPVSVDGVVKTTETIIHSSVTPSLSIDATEQETPQDPFSAADPIISAPSDIHSRCP